MNKRNLITNERIEKWSDEETLTNLLSILERVDIATEFIAEEVEDTNQSILTHEVIIARCGDKELVSEPQAFEWPLQLMPVPEAFENKLN